MAKKKHILNDEHPPFTLIGIASNERVFKVASLLNKSLGLNLALDVTREAAESVPSLYEDIDSQKDFEVQFYEVENHVSKAPKRAKPFRFWLLLVHLREEAPPVEEIMKKLKSIDEVSLAMDFSQEKDIHLILP